MSGDKPKADFSGVTSEVQSTAPIVEKAHVIYVVEKGDTLSKIAKEHYGKSGKWKAIFEANTDILKDPDRIQPGQELKLPKLDD